MTGADTNILIRYLIEDDAGQATRVHRHLKESRMAGEAVFVSVIVLCEVAWVLRTGYQRTKPEILSAIERLIELEGFQVEDQDLVNEAVLLARSGKGDFADYLTGLRNLRQGCRVTVTFDRALKDASAFHVW